MTVFTTYVVTTMKSPQKARKKENAKTSLKKSRSTSPKMRKTKVKKSNPKKSNK